MSEGWMEGWMDGDGLRADGCVGWREGAGEVVWSSFFFFPGAGGGKISPSDAVQRGRGVPMSCISAVGVVGKVGEGGLAVFGVFRKSDDTGITK